MRTLNKKFRQALAPTVVFQVAVLLATGNGAAASTTLGGLQEEDIARMSAMDKPLVEQSDKPQVNPPESETTAEKTRTEEPATPSAANAAKDESAPTQAQNSSDKKAWIYGGLGAAAAVAIVAAAAGGGGGSDTPATSATPDNSAGIDTSGGSGSSSSGGSGNGSSSGGSGNSSSSGGSRVCHESIPVNHNPRSPVANNPGVTPVCADLSGQWSGTIKLVGAKAGSASVSATISQDGGRIQISTSSSMAYGKTFIGSIDSGCHMLIYDQTTGEDWSTHRGPASPGRIALYDYVDISCYGYSRLDELVLTR
ncbi:MAG: hypothetical protein LBU39_05040 [Desulfobulbaceae bacterium]|jgi:hypothetical protein|nr:hypothetical protein [Desulfobulbaceae bacterium]